MPPSPRVPLFSPPSRTESHARGPIGMLMLASMLERAGHEVRLLDADFLRNSPTGR